MAKSAPTFGQKVIDFNASLRFDMPLPKGVSIMNPFLASECAIPASHAFYNKYYSDHNNRRAILGINPGRFGAGITGIPFTDPKRLAEFCDIHIEACPNAHEPSSLFVYEVIEAWGGLREFYDKWYINSICPLGFVTEGKNGRETNYNYYDSAELTRTALPFIVDCVRRQIAMGLERDVCFCLGTGKNYAFMDKLNAEHGFFERIVPLPHPRWVVQYRWSRREEYAREYVEKLREYS